MIEVLTAELRNEIRFMKNDINDLKASAQFQSNTIGSYNVKIDCIEKELKLIKDRLGSSDMDLINLEDKVEYMENSSRRNNIRIVGCLNLFILRSHGRRVNKLSNIKSIPFLKFQRISKLKEPIE